jgi:hypothetical protein
VTCTLLSAIWAQNKWQKDQVEQKHMQNTFNLGELNGWEHLPHAALIFTAKVHNLLAYLLFSKPMCKYSHGLEKNIQEQYAKMNCYMLCTHVYVYTNTFMFLYLYTHINIHFYIRGYTLYHIVLFWHTHMHISEK